MQELQIKGRRPFLIAPLWASRVTWQNIVSGQMGQLAIQTL